MIKTMPPRIKKAIRQLKTEISSLASGGIKRFPTPMPATAMPVIAPLFRVNHLATVEVSGTKTTPNPIPKITHSNRYNCQIECIENDNKKAAPASNPEKVKTRLGPILSFSLPAITPDIP